jgi:hypothetical protein
MSETKIHTRTKPQAKLYSNFFRVYTADKNTKGSGLNGNNHYLIQPPHNFLLNHILVCCCCSQIFELSHIFKGSISCLYVMIFPCILVISTYASFLLAFMNQKSKGKAQLTESLCCILILYIPSLHCCHRHIHGHCQDLFQGGLPNNTF